MRSTRPTKRRNELMIQAGRNTAEELTLGRDHALKQARDKKSTAQKLIEADENRKDGQTSQLRQRTAQLKTLEEQPSGTKPTCERLRDGERKRLPDDPAAAALPAPRRRLRRTDGPGAGRAAAGPAGGAKRDDLRWRGARTAARRHVTARGGRVEARRGIQVKAELDQIQPLLGRQAVERLQQAAEQATEAKTVLQQARDHLKELTRLDGSKTCRHCGQPLTEGHLQEEKRRRRHRRRRGGGQTQAGDAGAHQAAQQARAAGAGRLRQGGAAFAQDLRVEYSRFQGEGGPGPGRCAATSGKSAARFTANLPDAHRRRASGRRLPADWLATTHADGDRPGRAPRRRAGRAGGGRASCRVAGGIRCRDMWQQIDDAGGRQTPGMDGRLQATCRPIRRKCAANTPALETAEKRAGKRAGGSSARGLKDIEEEAGSADAGTRAGRRPTRPSATPT